ncbi:MAG: hypothetical protein CMJ64_05365 [Planctomycetaceae bacterium]|nr:hypothetical protein [Planctomycetaceae bacterium]
MRSKLVRPIIHSARRERERQLTQTVRVSSSDEVPPGYRQIRAPSLSIFAKVQVLSSQKGRPVFVEMHAGQQNQRVAYWVHEDVMPALAWWLRLRVFPAHEIVTQ